MVTTLGLCFVLFLFVGHDNYDEAGRVAPAMTGMLLFLQYALGFVTFVLMIWSLVKGARNSGGGDEKAKTKLKRTHGNDGKLVGYSSESSYTYKRQVTTTFGMDDLICHKCIRTQKCKKIGGSRNDHCKKWDDEVEECSDIQM